MTSTNDGKDVKSIQTSCQKGKTYYIELYKSLEARLNEECPLAVRCRHVCEAWRRVHSLCQHSAPKTLAHLLAWLQRHTARAVLHTEWPKSKDEHIHLDEAIQSFAQECEAAIASRDGKSPTWETHLMQRGEWFRKNLANPWGHPVLKVLLDPQGKPPSDNEVLEWLKEERGVVFVTRLRQLAASKCDDLALSLAAHVLGRARAADALAADGDGDNTSAEGAEPTFGDILKMKAGFTEDVWALLTDLEFVLLHKWNKQSQCIALAKKTPLRNGYQLVERLRCRLETSPREKKLWKNAKDAATLIAQVVIARCMVVPRCTGVTRDALQGCARALARLLPAARLPAVAAALAAPAATAAHLHALADAVHKQCTEEMKPFVCELYVRAITAGLNELEKLKMKTEKELESEAEAEARTAERTLSSWYTSLGTLLSGSARVQCECALTAFSVHPAPPLYERLQRAPALPTVPTDTSSKEETKSEFGSWANDSRSQTNLVKTSETLNLKQTQQQANVLSTAIFTEGEALGLSADLCQDLAVCLSGPRVKTLSWDMDRQELLANCRLHMERTDGGTRALTTELRYLNLDPNAYQHLPEEDEEESNLYYGIEKGYEHLVEFQEPEEVWQFDSRTETASSCGETESYVYKRKKKKHKALIEESDPLSLSAETEPTEKKKERPHSKERSKDKHKEHKKKKSEKDPDKEAARSKDPSQSKEKKKRKPKKEKEIPPPEERKPGSLSCLIGMKVIKPLEKKEEPEMKFTACVTDSDYDSQGKSSMNSEGNDPNVVFDGLFSMDDYKSPERNKPVIDKQVTKNNEWIGAHDQVAVNSTLRAVSKLNLDMSQSVSNNSVSTQPAVMSPTPLVKSASNVSVSKQQPSTVSEEVKRSITKLLEFRRKRYANEQALKANSNNNSSVPSKNNLNVEQRPNAVPTPDFSTQSFSSSKSLPVPKMYINKSQTENHQLKQEGHSIMDINKEVLHIRDRGTVTLQMPTPSKNINKSMNDSSFVNTTTSNYMDILNVSSNKNTAVPTSSSNVDRSNTLNNQPYRLPQNYNVLGQQYSTITEPTGQKFQEFLRELQESINAGTGCKALEKTPLLSNSNVIVKKELKPMSKVIPVIPNARVKIDRKKSPPSAKQVVHQKKVENAPNTFSRLSYMHKNKQSDAKQKQLDVSSRQDQIKDNSIDLVRSVAENKVENVRSSQSNGNPVISRVDARIQYPKHSEIAYANRKSPKHSLSKDHPLISNILQSNEVKQSSLNMQLPSQVTRDDYLTKNIPPNTEQPTVITSPIKTSYLSEKDQNDLILLLRQQNLINSNRFMPKGETSTNNKIVKNWQSPISIANDIIIRNNSTYKSTSNPQSNPAQEYEGQKYKTSELANIKVSDLVNHNSTRILENKQIKVINPVINSSKNVNHDRNIIKKTIKSKIDNVNEPNSSLPNQQKTRSPQDWLTVMNAIRAQKTPSRGSNALEMALNKDSQNSLRKQRIVKTTSLGDNNIKTANVSHNNPAPYKMNTIQSVTSSVPINQPIISEDVTRTLNTNIQSKQVGDMNKTMHIEPYKKLQCEQKKHTSELTHQKDPFISGLENSDYDLLEELMDDELRQEIGELSSDDDYYRGTSLQKNIKNTNKIDPNIAKQTEKPYKGKAEFKPNQNILNRLQNPNEAMVEKSAPKVPVLKINYPTTPVIESPVMTCSALTTNKNVSFDYTGKETIKISHNIPTAMVNNVVQCKKNNITVPKISTDRSGGVTKGNNNNQTQESKNICINATPQPQPALQNVVLLGSDTFYDPYSVIQSHIRPPYVVSNNLPNITLHHSTRLTAPVVSSAVIGNPITTSPVNFQSNEETTSKNLSRSLTVLTNAGGKTNIVHHSNTKLDLKSGRDVSHFQDNMNEKSDNKITLDVNYNKNCERKVLSEVQEKQKLAAIEKSDCKIMESPKITTDEMLNDSLRIQEFDDSIKISKFQKNTRDNVNILKVIDQEQTDAKRLQCQMSNDNYRLKEPLKVQVSNDSNSTLKNQRITITNYLQKELLVEQGKNDAKISTKSQVIPNNNDPKIEILKTNTNDEFSKIVQENVSSLNKTLLEESLKKQENNNLKNQKQIDNATKTIKDIKDLERLKNKRIAIITRKINHRSYPPIPLPYIPLIAANKSDSVIKNNSEDNIEDLANKNETIKRREDLNIADSSNKNTINQILSNEYNKESNSIPVQTRGIVLRSSNRNIEKFSLDINTSKDKSSNVRLKNDVTKTVIVNKKVHDDEKTTNLKERKLVVTKRVSKRILNKKVLVKSNFGTILKKNSSNQSCEKVITVAENVNDCSADKSNLDIEDELLASKIPNTKHLENIHLSDNVKDVIAQQSIDIVSQNTLSTTKNENNESTVLQPSKPKIKRVKKAKNKFSVGNKNSTNTNIEHKKEQVQRVTDNVTLPLSCEFTTPLKSNLESSSDKSKNLHFSHNVPVIVNKHKRKNRETIRPKKTSSMSGCERKKIDEFVNPQEVGFSEGRVIKENGNVTSKTLCNKKEDSDGKNLPPKSVEKRVSLNKNVIEETNINLQNKLMEATKINKLEKNIDKINEDRHNTPLNKRITSLLCDENIDLTNDDVIIPGNEEFIGTAKPKSLNVVETTKSNQIFNREIHNSISNENKQFIMSHIDKKSKNSCNTNSNLDQLVRENNTKEIQSPNATLSNQSPIKKKISIADNVEPKRNSDIDTNSSTIPEYIKNKIIIEEVPMKNSNDPNKKCLRIKLPNGKVFKATVYGKLHTDYDSLFADPTIKSMLLSNVSNNKRYTLNIKQVTTHNKDDPTKPVKTRIEDIQMRSKPVMKQIETINLLSDDEDDTSKYFVFETEFGSYKTSLTDQAIFERHQSRFAQKSCIKLNRYVPKEIDTELHSDVYFLDDNQSADNGGQEILTSDVQDKPVLNTFVQSKCADNVLHNVETSPIVIDESSNDSIDLLKNCPNLPTDVISITQDSVNQLQEVSFTDTLEKDKISENDTKTDNIAQDNSDENNIELNESICEQQEVNEPPKKPRDCFIPLLKCDDLVNKYIDICERKCFVKLIRCDELIRNETPPSLSKKTVSNCSDFIIMDAERFIPASIIDCNKSLSNLNEGLSYCDDIVDGEAGVKISRSTSPVIDIFETIAALRDINVKKGDESQFNEHIICKSEWFTTKHQLRFENMAQCVNNCHVQQGNTTNSHNIKNRNENIDVAVLCKKSRQRLIFDPQCDWFTSKRQLHYNEHFIYRATTYEQRKTKLKGKNDQCENKIIDTPPLNIRKVPSLKSLLTLYFQTNPLIKLKSCIKRIPNNIFQSTHNLKRKSAANPYSVLATKISRNTINETQCYNGDKLHDKKNGQIIKINLRDSDKSTMDHSNKPVKNEVKTSNSKDKKPDKDINRKTSHHRSDLTQINNFEDLAKPDKSIENVTNYDNKLHITTHSEQFNRKIIVEVNIEKLDPEPYDKKINEENILVNDTETQVLIEKSKDLSPERLLKETSIANNSEEESGQSLNSVIKIQNKKSEQGILYSLLLNHKYTKELIITNKNNEPCEESSEVKVSENDNSYIEKCDEKNLSPDMVLQTKGKNCDKNGYDKIMSLCKDNVNVLQDVENEDPVVGMYYVFPVEETESVSNRTNNTSLSYREQIVDVVEDSDDIVNSYDDTDLKVLVPKYTYSKCKENEEILEGFKIKKNLKRKIDVVDGKVSGKKYRKGKNIDYPKITAAAIIESAYSKEYKRLFDYCSSLKFSLSRSFLREQIDVYDMIKDWPIKNSNLKSGEICPDTTESALFLDSNNVYTNYNILNPTLSEEISAEYNNDYSVSSNENETNFKMGFGEGSGRVIQNLGIDDYSKVSAATLSDVKQLQPFIISGDYNDDVDNTNATLDDQVEKIKRYISHIKLHDKVQSFFKKTTMELKYDLIKESRKDKFDSTDLSLDLFFRGFMEPSPIDTIVQVVQVGQLPVSAAAQNPVTCDPRVTQVSNASPSQCSVENSPRDDSQTAMKTEYTELTTANLTLPLVDDYGQHNQSITMDHETSNLQTTDENIPIETEIKSVVKIELMEELPEEKDEVKEPHENNESQNLVNDHINNVDYVYDTNNSDTALDDSNIQELFNTTEKQIIPETFPQDKQQNGGSEKTDQIAHAMNAAGITTATETIANSRAQALVNILSQKIHQDAVASSNTQSTTNNYSKTTSINAMALQQALAQILPPPLNQTNISENNTQTTNTQVAPQVLHIVQGKNASGSQITLVDNSQQSVISTPNATPVLHIVQNKSGATGVTANGASGAQPNTFSGLSLVDTGLQQGGNQLLHIVNTGSQKNNNTGQLLKRVNLLTNLANVQGSNEQKMVQFVCKSADGKAIQLNAPHQRSMVLRLQPIETPNVQTNQTKPAESQDINTTPSVTLPNKDAQQEIKSRSVYEENYAKFIQNSSNKPTVPEKSTSLPKFNQAFGKPVFQDGNQKSNDMNSSNNSHLSSITTTSENAECQQTTDNSVNLEHIGQINSPPLLLRKSPAQTSQAQPNLVQQIKQTIAPMNIQTMHGGVIYTRQIPVNIGGGQTINLITVPSTELIDDSGQKQSTDVKFVNQGDIEPSIIKIVPQSQTASNSEISTEENNGHLGVSNDNVQNQQPQPQPVLTQMRIKLPMLSKTPHMVSGARVVRPSFFQIQRNVIGGANQPVYQQLVLTAAPPLGQQTIRLPQAQTTRQIKVPTESQSSAESQMSSSTLEQLREFDMVLEQVKERSTVQPNSNNSFSKLLTPSTDTTDAVSVSSTPAESTQVLYSIGNNQPLNVAYVNRKTTVTNPNTPGFVRSPDSSGIVESPTSSTHVQIPHTVTTETSPNEMVSQPKPAKVGSKSKSRPKSSHHPSSMKINSVPPKTSAQKPLEDEQTTQRILYILAEYKEQVENSPDKDKPAPRRRSNPPSNPSGSSKRKKGSSSCRRPGARDMSPVHGDDTCRTMGSEDSSCGTSQGDCNESCLESHSPQDSPRKVVRKLTFEHETPAAQPRPLPPRNVIVADGQTITVARGAAGKPTTAVLMPANYILPVSMVKGGQQIAIVTNRGPKLLTVGGGEGGTTNALLLQRLIGPAGLKPVLARPGVRHVRLPTAALHNLQAFNLAAATTVQPPDSTASPAPAATPPELVETKATASPWTDRESQELKPDRGSSPDGSEPWNLPSAADPHDYTYEETVRADNMDRTVLDPIPDRYSPDMEAQRIFDKMFDVDSKKSYIVDSHDDSPRGGYDIDASDCEDKSYQQVVQKKDGISHRQHRLTHVSAAALRHKYAILEHELRLQKSLSEECEDLGVDSPSASDLFPEAELLFAASPAHDHTQDHTHQSHTPQPTLLNQSGIPQPDIDDQIATDQLLPREPMERHDLNLGLEDVGIVTVSEDGMQATIALDQEEFARSHPNTTFHSEPTDETEVHPFTLSGLKGRHITSTIFHSNRAPATVLMTTPQTTVISQAAAESSNVQNVKYSDIDNMIHSLPSSHSNNINLSSVLVKDDGLTRFDSILNDSRELHLSNTASAIVHSGGNATQVIRRVCYDDDKRDRDSRFLMDEPDALIAGDDAKMIAEDSSRDATLESITGDVDDDGSSPDRHTELFWESNSASERSESRRPLDYSSDSDKCCKSPSGDETNSTDSSGGVGGPLRLSSVIKAARSGRDSADGSSDDAPPPRTYPPQRSLSGKTRAGEREPDAGRRRASGRGVVKRGCHCCNGEPAPSRAKRPRQRRPAVDFAVD